MSGDPPEYDPRYLVGVLLFNRGDYFEAHDAWEELWGDTPGPYRTFYQGLIQAAVGLCHFCNGNARGAAKLYRTSRAYLERYPSPHLGLDVADFLRQMERCFAPLLGPADPPRVAPDEALLPTITLDPPPAAWPEPDDFVGREDH